MHYLHYKYPSNNRNKSTNVLRDKMAKRKIKECEKRPYWFEHVVHMDDSSCMKEKCQSLTMGRIHRKRKCKKTWSEEVKVSPKILGSLKMRKDRINCHYIVYEKTMIYMCTQLYICVQN